MPDDPIAVLERELVDAARRRMPTAPGAPTRRRGSLGAFAAVVLSGIAVVVALGALLSLRAHKPTAHTVPVHPATIPGRQRLIDVLGVLRRPQTKADLGSSAVRRLLRQIPPGLAALGTPDLPLIRRVLTPSGTAVVLVPMKPPTAAWLAALRKRNPNLPAKFYNRPQRTEEGLYLGDGGGGGCCATAAELESQGDMLITGTGPAFAGGSATTRLTIVVPDGVATVDFVLPRQPAPGEPGAPVYRSVETISAPVRDNIAMVQFNRQCCEGGTPMIWKAADGRVVKRIGDLAAANRVIPPPKPGPETALSRAAERNPSTPNRVWVTPSVGGPHTNFKLHFQVLLNDADYSYRLSGARCPGITVNGGDGGGTNDVRGRIWSDAVDAVAGQAWCPGTYHLSVTIMDLGRGGSLKHPAQPFGTATFTVKR